MELEKPDNHGILNAEESFRLASSLPFLPISLVHVTTVTIVVYTDWSIRISRLSLPWLAKSGLKLAVVTNPSLTPTIDFGSGRCPEVSLITMDRHFNVALTKETRWRPPGKKWSVKRILEIGRRTTRDATCPDS